MKLNELSYGAKFRLVVHGTPSMTLYMLVDYGPGAKGTYYINLNNGKLTICNGLAEVEEVKK